MIGQSILSAVEAADGKRPYRAWCGIDFHTQSALEAYDRRKAHERNCRKCWDARRLIRGRRSSGDDTDADGEKRKRSRRPPRL